MPSSDALGEKSPTKLSRLLSPKSWFGPSLLADLHTQRRKIFLGLFCTAVSAGIVVGMVKVIELTIAAFENQQWSLLLWMSGAVVALFGVKYWFQKGQVFFLSQAAVRLTADLRVRLFEKLQRLPVSYFNERRTGAIQSVITNDVNVYQNAMTVVRDAVDGPVRVVGGVLAIFLIQWQLALTAMLVLPVLIWIIQRNAKQMKEAQAQVQGSLSDLNALSIEALQGTRVVRSFGAEKQLATEYQNLIQDNYNKQVRAIDRIASLRPAVEFVGATGLALVLVVIAVFLPNSGLTPATLSAFFFGLDVINQGAKSMGQLNNTLAQVQAASERIHAEILDAPEEVVKSGVGTDRLEKVKGHLVFEEVSFEYPDGTRALRTVSFEIKPGESLALVGPSGAGKSTIADLLLRFYPPSHGRILLDGEDIQNFDLGWYRDLIGVVPQQTFLFAGTIRANLKIANPEATDEQLILALKAAHAYDFVMNSRDGLDTVLGERGVRLSGGEIQRIAIARAIVRDPSLLILDEATSNLDVVSEREVQSALDEIMKERTSLFIAHRLTTAARASKVLLLRRGEVVEQGTHSQLMQADGTYAAMYRAFSSGMMGGEIV